jgi:AraC-like DNA-binding protein
MKPFLEKVPVMPGMSWAMLNRRLDDGIPFQWHHHPEYELTLTLNSRGQRFIGDHIGSFDEGDLVLVGPNLPHTWSSSEKLVHDQPHVALVMWFTTGWTEALSGRFAELQPLAGMLERAAGGLSFSGAVSSSVRPLVERLFQEPEDERLLSLIRVLSMLARDMNAKQLASPAFVPHRDGADRGRIDRVLDHVHLNYASDVSIPALADIAALSASGLHRLFRRHTHMTVSEYVQRLKIGEACALLSGSRKPIAHIADAVGYASLANFNRQFRAMKGVTPREYRQKFATNA